VREKILKRESNQLFDIGDFIIHCGNYFDAGRQTGYSQYQAFQKYSAFKTFQNSQIKPIIEEELGVNSFICRAIQQVIEGPSLRILRIDPSTTLGMTITI